MGRKFFLLLLLLLVLGVSIKEGLKNSCSSRSNCSKCLGSYDSTGSVCYWCKNKGCVNPDDYYDYNTCSSDKQKCSVSKVPKRRRFW
jgi:hypothetical protein